MILWPILLILFSAGSYAAEPLIYPGADPTTAIISMHGMGRDGQKMSGYAKFQDKTTATVAYPTGIDNDWRDRDIPAIEALVDQLRAGGAERVFLSGASKGAIMAMRVACAIPDKIDGIAPVIGLHPKNTVACAFDVPFLLVAGTADPLIKWDGSFWHFSARETMVMWSDCSEPDSTEMLPDIDKRDGSQVWLEDYCGTPLYRVEGGGHAWPGAPSWRTNRDIDATKVIWEWFQSLAPVAPPPTDCEKCLLECAK